MRAEIWQDQAEERDEGRFWQRQGRTILTAASGTFLALGFVLHAISKAPVPIFRATTPAK